MRPLVHADGHDAPRLIDEVVPGETAVVDDVVVGFDPKGGEANMRFDEQFDRTVSSGMDKDDDSIGYGRHVEENQGVMSPAPEASLFRIVTLL